MPALPHAGRSDARRRSRCARRHRSPTAGSAAQWLRIDLADRLASHAHKVRSAGGDEPVDADAGDLASGSTRTAIAKLMDEIGFTRAGEAWRWRGRRPRAASDRPHPRRNAFAELAKLKR